MHKGVLYIFVGLIIVFTIIIVWFTYKNNWAVETIDIGAILFSLYLGFNSLAIKKPDLKSKIVDIGFIHDEKNGLYFSIANHSELKASLDYSLLYNGIGASNRIIENKKFSSIDFRDALKLDLNKAISR